MHRYLTQATLILTFVLVAQAGASLQSKITIHARQGLTITAGTYSSILFQAEYNGDTQAPSLPLQYEFHTSGDMPPGMLFENYPCNKPGQQNCPALASSDGIYLDGVPRAAGSYRVTISARTPGGEAGERDFTITVKPSRH